MHTEVLDLFEDQLKTWAMTLALAQRALQFREDQMHKLDLSQASPQLRQRVGRISELIIDQRERINESKAALSNAWDRLDHLREVELPESFTAEDVATALAYLRTGR